MELLVRAVLWLRYRIRVVGLADVARRGTRGILFLPNHPALNDPVILLTVLYRRFRPRPLGDRDQIDRFFVRWVAARMRALEIPDPVKDGHLARDEIFSALDRCAAALDAGDNLLVYPSGHLQTSRLEDLRGNSAVDTILARRPGTRVVLVRIRGLWGSSFSRAQGVFHPDIARCLARGARGLLASGVLFAPRRRVTIELSEPDDLPRRDGRQALNRYLEDAFNRDPSPNTYVPYSIWERGGVRRLPDPEAGFGDAGLAPVPDATRRLVADELHRLTGIARFEDSQHLAHDLGLDSLTRAELIVWLEREFGFPQGDVDALQSVGDLMLAASGHAVTAAPRPLTPVPSRWFRTPDVQAVRTLAPGDTVPEAFLAQALAAPSTPIIADQAGGVRSYRQMLIGIGLLGGPIRALDGERVGIMLPASVAADVVFLATLFAGRTPVMVNWTVGPRNVLHGLEVAGATRVLTARALVDRLAEAGTDFGGYDDRFVFLEHLVGGASTRAKARAAAVAAVAPRSLLPDVGPDEVAVVLFTSGSEALPKAVPLTHANLLANLRDICSQVEFRASDRLLSILPPFHSFGLTAGMLMPLLTGLQTVHHANPRDAPMLAELIETYRATLMGGTPTFLAGMVRAARPGQLDSLRLAVTGGERCPPAVYDALRRACRNALILEGYGITECSPIVSINSPALAKPGTIGRVLPSLDYRIVDLSSGAAAAPGSRGVLLVRGPSVFGGYLGDAPSPFVDRDGETWFDTGDVVSEDLDRVLTYRGRVRRFVKLGGEMISLPAIEEVLAERLPVAADEQPTFALVAAGHDEHPELTLCSTLPLERQEVNLMLRDAGLSPLHNVRRIVTVSEIPTLGTGKTDYRSLQERIPGLER